MKKVAFVTGASKGIGAAIVKELCEKGFSVAVNYLHSEQGAMALCSELALKDFNVLPIKCDVSSETEVINAVNTIEKELGTINVLVNNAGISHWGLFDETTSEQWHKIMDTNLTSMFNCSKAVLPGMLKNKYGRIINISSVWGQVGASCEAVYSASKAGVIGLSKAMAKEYALSGITVNCIAPGVIDTDMMKQFSPDEIKLICEDIPAGRMGLAKEVAFAVSFFADERAAYITGQTIGVNGGMV